jgi:hypothetical protein
MKLDSSGQGRVVGQNSAAQTIPQLVPLLVVSLHPPKFWLVASSVGQLQVLNPAVTLESVNEPASAVQRNANFVRKLETLKIRIALELVRG